MVGDSGLLTGVPPRVHLRLRQTRVTLSRRWGFLEPGGEIPSPATHTACRYRMISLELLNERPLGARGPAPHRFRWRPARTGAVATVSSAVGNRRGRNRGINGLGTVGRESRVGTKPRTAVNTGHLAPDPVSSLHPPAIQFCCGFGTLQAPISVSVDWVTLDGCRRRWVRPCGPGETMGCGGPWSIPPPIASTF